MAGGVATLTTLGIVALVAAGSLWQPGRWSPLKVLVSLWL